MADPFLGEIRIVSFQFAPKGWALCNGQTLSISQNAALFSLLGTYYGGNGTQTFQLPNFQARMPIHVGQEYVQGQVGGEGSHTLIVNEIPAHNHGVTGTTAIAASASGSANLWAASAENPYAAAANLEMSATALGASGGGQPHDNMPPYLTLNFVIALSGIYPARN